MERNIQAGLFDLDGVLVDTAKYHYQAWRKLANTMGFDVSLQQNEQLKGISRIESLDRLLAWGGISLPSEARKQLAERKNTWYVELISKMTPDAVLPGARELLAALRHQGVRTALGSASKNAQLILEKTGLEEYFEVVVDGNLVTRSKPDPEVFLTGAARLGIPPECCVVFEDAEAGIIAAKRARMKVVGVGHAAELREADWVVSDLAAVSVEQLDKLFESTPGRERE